MGLFDFITGGAEGRARRKAKRDDRRANRRKNKEERRTFKLAKVKLHADAKTERVKQRQIAKIKGFEADEVAYAHGMQPRHKGDGLAAFGKQALGAVEQIFGGKDTTSDYDNTYAPGSLPGDQPGSSMMDKAKNMFGGFNPLLLIGLIIAAFAMLGGRKSPLKSR